MTELKKFEAVGPYILVKLDEKQIKNTAGLNMPNREVLTGEVISVGNGSPGWPEMKCKVGQRIKWHRHSGERLKVDGVECIILNEEKREIQGII
jgi:co-chaperonin GroES (HSP10)